MVNLGQVRFRGRPAVHGHAARFSGADLIESHVHLRHDMETIEDMEGLGALFANDLQMGSHMWEQTKTIFEATSSPIVLKNP